MLIYVMTGYNLEVTAKYLEMYADLDENSSLSSLSEWIEHTFAQMSADSVARLQHPVAPDDVRIRESAIIFLAENRFRIQFSLP